MSKMVSEVIFPLVTIAKNSTGYTNAWSFQACIGFAATKITVSAGSVTISQQCSPNGINWFDAVDSSDVALGVVTTAMSTNTAGKYVQYNPVLAKFLRFKIVELNVDTAVVGISFYCQE